MTITVFTVFRKPRDG